MIESRVGINRKLFTGSNIKIGFPQGPIFGPFLVLVYINDIPYFVKDYNEIVLFADNTFLLFRLQRQKQVIDEINIAILKVFH